MIKAVMFDMGGTLEDLYSDEKNDKATAYALYDILKKHQMEVPLEAEPLCVLLKSIDRFIPIELISLSNSNIYKPIHSHHYD